MRYLACCLCILALAAPVGRAETDDLTDVQIQDIITKFAAKEAEFARAREVYTYRQTMRVQELDPGGSVRGRHEMVSDIIFSPEGKRTERVVFAPVSTLSRIQLTPQDEQDLRDVQPFVLTTEDLPKYHVRYLGRQQVDEIPCFVFATKPKTMVEGERYFQGQVWVDDRDLQIVKTYGRGVGLLRKNSDNQFPKFETYREQIDGKYWFPTYTSGNDTLHFRSGPQRIRLLVKYENYKQFKSDVKILYGDEVVSEETKDP